MDGQRTLKMRLRVVVPEADGFPVRFHQRRLPAERLVEKRTDDLRIDVEQRRQRARIRDVLHEDPLAHGAELLVAHFREWNAEIRHVRTREARIERPRRVVHEPSARTDFRDILVVCRRVHRHQQIEVRRPRGVAVPAHPDLVPGRESLDVRRKHVLSSNRHAHAEDGLHDQAVGRRRPGAVRRRNLEGKVVYAIHGVNGLRGLMTQGSSWLRVSSQLEP